jgi:hypothetical protein
MSTPHRHHLTGRAAPKRPYFHRDLTVPLAPADHAALHAALRAAGLDYPRAHNLLDFWRRRTAFQLRLLASQGRSVGFGPPALGELAAIIDGWDDE